MQTRIPLKREEGQKMRNSPCRLNLYRGVGVSWEISLARTNKTTWNAASAAWPTTWLNYFTDQIKNTQRAFCWYVETPQLQMFTTGTIYLSPQRPLVVGRKISDIEWFLAWQHRAPQLLLYFSRRGLCLRCFRLPHFLAYSISCLFLTSGKDELWGRRPWRVL